MSKTTNQLSDYVENIYLQIEREILDNIAKMLLMPADIRSEDILQWQFMKLSQLGLLTQQNYAYMASKLGLTEEAVKELISKEGLAASALIDGALGTAAVLTTSNTVMTRLLALQATAKSKFNLVNTSMLSGAQQVYRDIVNETTAKVLTGMRTPRQALKEVAGKWAEHGIPTIRDKAGRKWSTEAYVPMVVKSTRKTVASEMQLGRMDDHEIDLIEVSSKPNARPKCRVDQGKIYSKSGKSERYPAWSTTSYGQPDGLLGVHCGHNIYPFVEGRSTQRYFPYPEKEVEKNYDEQQEQRSIERSIRAKKKKVQMMEGIKSAEGVEEAKKQLRHQQKRMREFIKRTGRGRKPNREQIV